MRRMRQTRRTRRGLGGALVGLGFALATAAAAQDATRPVSFASPADTGVAARIERVAGGLLAPIQVRGRPTVRYDIAERMRALHVPAISVAVIDGGRIDWAAAWGEADRETGLPATPATLFQAASISKPIAALGALALVEAGKIDLDIDVGTYLRDWDVPREAASGGETGAISLRRLLSHTAGLTVHGFRGYARGETVPNVYDVLDGAGSANSPPVVADVPPGAQWRYSGGGYTVVQLLMEEVAERPFSVQMRDVLDALGMRSSTFEQPLPDSLAARVARGHRADARPVAGGWHTYPELAAAGLWTTPSDVARYAIAVGRWLAGEPGGVIGPALTREMLAAGLEGWGLGPSTEGSGLDFRFGHGGANEGFRSEFVYFPRRGIGAVIMTNGDAGESLVREVLFSIAAAYEWPDIAPREIRALPLSTGEAVQYAGRYRVEETPDLDVEVRWRSGRLELRVGEGPYGEIVLVARDRFVILSDGAALRFERDAAGRIRTAVAYGGRARRTTPR